VESAYADAFQLKNLLPYFYHLSFAILYYLFHHISEYCKTNKHGRYADDIADQHICYRKPCFAFTKQAERFKRVRGKCREPAQDTDKQKRPQIRPDRSPLENTPQKSYYERADQIDRQCSPREHAPKESVRKAAKAVPAHRADPAAQRYQQHFYDHPKLQSTLENRHCTINQYIRQLNNHGTWSPVVVSGRLWSSKARQWSPEIRQWSSEERQWSPQVVSGFYQFLS
jgi:hypothetical protein